MIQELKERKGFSVLYAEVRWWDCPDGIEQST